MNIAFKIPRGWRTRRHRLVLIFLSIILSLVVSGCRRETETLVLATTTSTYDSGLLDDILPDFEASNNATVEVISVGTGQALKLGEAGDADVLLVHARTREDEFMAAGHGIERFDIMYNDFIILGPASDPAGIQGETNVATALQKIAAVGATFASRGDDSGTHIRELALWAEAGVEPAGDWYLSVGQGMGATLTLAAEENAYVLADRSTYLARRVNGLALVVISEGDGRLRNPYGLLLVDPAKSDNINADLARAFAAWLISGDTQQAIADYRVAGEQLFFPLNLSDEELEALGEGNVDGANASPFLQAFSLIMAGDAGLWQIVWLSLLVSGIALAVAALIGIPAGAFLGLRQFRGQKWIRLFVYTGMGFPPVVVGLAVYLALSNQGPFGSFNWLFSPLAMIMAQIILAFPLVVGITMSAVRSVPAELRMQLVALGATKWQVTQTILHEARYGVIVAVVAGFGAAISEVGAVMLVGGNIDGRTRVLTTAIVLETRRGNFEFALALGFVLLFLAFLANYVVSRYQEL